MHRVDAGVKTPNHTFPKNFRTIADTPALFWNAIQDEICHVIEASGLTLSDDRAQLREATKRLKEIKNKQSFLISNINLSGSPCAVNIPGMTPLKLESANHVSLYLTLILKRRTDQVKTYITVFQEFIRFEQGWLNTSKYQHKDERSQSTIYLLELNPSREMTLCLKSAAAHSYRLKCSCCKKQIFSDRAHALFEFEGVRISHLEVSP